MNINKPCVLLALVICFIAGIGKSLAQNQHHVFALGDTAFLFDGKPMQMISGEMNC